MTPQVPALSGRHPQVTWCTCCRGRYSNGLCTCHRLQVLPNIVEADPNDFGLTHVVVGQYVGGTARDTFGNRFPVTFLRHPLVREVRGAQCEAVLVMDITNRGGEGLSSLCDTTDDRNSRSGYVGGSRDLRAFGAGCHLGKAPIVG